MRMIVVCGDARSTPCSTGMTDNQWKTTCVNTQGAGGAGNLANVHNKQQI